MSTLKATNIQNASSATTNIALDTSGNGTFAGTAVMSSPYTMRNKIINGAMVIDQRNAGASVTPSSGTTTYIVDRYGIYVSQASKLTAQQNAASVTPAAGFRNYLGITSSSAYSSLAADVFVLYQAIEGLNCIDLAFGTANAKTVTVSFWVRSSITGTHSGSLVSDGNTRCYPFSFAISAANTWEYKTVTIPGDTTGTWLTTNGVGMALKFNLGSGSNTLATAGVWASGEKNGVTGSVSLVGTNGATFYITGVQLEIGTVATPFEYRNYQQELAMCQRYCYVLPNTNSVANGMWGSMYNTTAGRVFMTLPVTMRSSPSISGLTGSNTFEILAVANVSSATITGTASSTSSVTFDGTSMSSSSIAGQPIAYKGPGTFSAEL